MSDFNYNSYIDFVKNPGGSSVYSDSGSAVSSVGALSESGGDGFFDSGEGFSSGQTGSFLGTFTDAGGIIYVIVQTSATTWRIYSPVDATATDANLPNTIKTSDVDSSQFSACFAIGTMIATSIGAVAVENLRIGDLVRTIDGRTVAVRWIGRQTVMPLFKPAERLMPVRIDAGALGEGVPLQDLVVTADHALLVDGILCHAGALVNGATIRRVPTEEMGARYTVFHVDTETHEIIFANGAPAESFIDNQSRRVFDNWSEFWERYGDVPEMKELPLPRAMSARQVPAAISARLLCNSQPTGSCSRQVC